MVKLADTQDLGSCAFGRGGSSPPLRTAVIDGEIPGYGPGFFLFNAPFYAPPENYSRFTHPLLPIRRIPSETPPNSLELQAGDPRRKRITGGSHTPFGPVRRHN